MTEEMYVIGHDYSYGRIEKDHNQNWIEKNYGPYVINKNIIVLENIETDDTKVFILVGTTGEEGIYKLIYKS